MAGVEAVEEVILMHTCGCTGDTCPHEDRAKDMAPPEPGTEDLG